MKNFSFLPLVYTLIYTLIAIAIIAMVTTPLWIRKTTVRHETFTVTKAERVMSRNGDSAKYMVFATDGRVYQNVDSWLFQKFNSATVYARIGTGQTCTALVEGWRVEFLSWQPNILAVECK